MTEAISGFFLATLVLAGSGQVLISEWSRIRCARSAFESALRARNENPDTLRNRLRTGVRTRLTPNSVLAIAQCGQAREEVELSTLEHFQ